MRWRYVALATAATLAACSKPGNEPPFDRAWIPPAPGSGNFEICLNTDAEENGFRAVTVPAGVVFQSWGPMTGPLRDRLAIDNGVGAAPRASALGEERSYAVITTVPTKLTMKAPCARTPVRAVLSDGFTWTRKVVPAAKHQNFEPFPSKIVAGTVSTDLWGDSGDGLAGDAIASAAYHGTMLSDAGDPVTLGDAP